MTQPGYTIEEFARALKKSESTVRRMIRAGALKAVKYSPRDTRITTNEAERFLNHGITDTGN
ncbi:helix-turn-helix domain-containing protein [Coraliomargarita parva]|uniref:helix-turn-helix domain-containing protein n=1 Tax=Coraliomargarita parva TaxID=3014050 RepID=UPI003CE47A11